MKTRNDSNGNMKPKPMKPIVHQPGLPGRLFPIGIHIDISFIYPFDLFKLELKRISFMSHPANQTRLYPNILKMMLFGKVSTATQLKILRSILLWGLYKYCKFFQIQISNFAVIFQLPGPPWWWQCGTDWGFRGAGQVDLKKINL